MMMIGVTCRHNCTIVNRTYSSSIVSVLSRRRGICVRRFSDMNVNNDMDDMDGIPPSVLCGQFQPYEEPVTQAWVWTLERERLGIVDLDPRVFGLTVRKDLIQRVVEWQRQKSRAPIQAVKGRSDVVGSNRKLAQQKGSGKARVGSAKSPIRRGGGKAMARKARSMAFDMPKIIRRLGLMHALSAKQHESNLVILNHANPESHKTGYIRRLMGAWNSPSMLVIDGVNKIHPNMLLGSRRVTEFDVNWLPSRGANVFDILRHRTLFVTLEGLRHLHARALREPLMDPFEWETVDNNGEENTLDEDDDEGDL